MFDVIFGNSNTIQYTFTLADAQKIRSKIHYVLSDFNVIRNLNRNKDLSNFELSLSKIKITDPSELYDELLDTFEERKENNSQVLALKMDALKLKELIFKRNIEVGISKKLNEIEMCKLKLKFLESVDTSDSLKNSSVNEQIRQVVNFYANANLEMDTSVIVNCPFYDIDAVKEKILMEKKKIFELEQEITNMNANTKIDVDLFEYTTEKIGV